VQKWKFWLRSKNDDVLLVAKAGWRMKRVPISCKGVHWRWIMDLRVWSGKKKADCREEAERFTSQENSEQESLKNQDCAHFFFIRRVVQHEFVPQGQTVNAAFYVEVLKCMCECVRPELWAEKKWILHHDSAPSHSAFIVCEFFARFSPPRLFFSVA
jgi:hypothetical protein